MQSVVKTAKTVDEAVNLALEALGASLDDVSIEILEKEKNGLFGLIGSKDAVVRVTRNGAESAVAGMEDPATVESHANLPIQENAMAEPDTVSFSAEKPVRTETDGEEEIEPSHTETSDEEETELSRAEMDDEEETELSRAEMDDEEETELSRAETIEESQEESAITEEEMAEEALHDHMNDSVVEPIPREKILLVEEELETILQHMHIDCSVSVSEREGVIYGHIENISDADTGIVIGRRAETLNALQYLLNVIANRHAETYHRVFLNVGDYRERRKESIERLAQRSADRALRTHRSVALEPMNAYERRIVHFALQKRNHISTVSEGKDPYRKVVIHYER